MVGSTLCRSNTVNNLQTGTYTRVIDEAGPDIKYMLLSLEEMTFREIQQGMLADLQQRNRKDLVCCNLIYLI